MITFVERASEPLVPGSGELLIPTYMVKGGAEHFVMNRRITSDRYDNNWDNLNAAKAMLIANNGQYYKLNVSGWDCLGMDLKEAECKAWCICGFCGHSLKFEYGGKRTAKIWKDSQAGKHAVAVCVRPNADPDGDHGWSPAFAPVTPEGAERFMTGGAKPKCRICESEHLYPEDYWIASDLCGRCQGREEAT